MPVAGAIGGAIVGGLISKRSTDKAANLQADTARETNASNSAATAAALAENRRQFDLTRSDILPGIQRGNAAGNRLQELLGLGGLKSAQGYGSLMQRFNGQGLEQEPGYQFGLQQGQRGLDNSAAARGGYYSGAQLKAASRFNNDYASTKYGDAYNRDKADKDSIYNRLSLITGAGQLGASQVGQLGASMANNNGQLITQNAYNNGNNMIGAANARASSYLSQGNALQNVVNAGASALGNYFGGSKTPPPDSNAEYRGMWGA